MRHTIQVKYLQELKNLPAKLLTRQKSDITWEAQLWKCIIKAWSHTRKIKQTFLNVCDQSSNPYELYLLEHSQADELILCKSDKNKQFCSKENSKSDPI